MSICETAPHIWCEDFKIHSYEIGVSGFVSPQSLCRFMQEAASNHSDRLTGSVEEMAAQQQMWVLCNLSLRMKEYPRWHQTIKVETWPVGKGSRLRAYREFTLRMETGEIAGHASTMWLLLNTETRRPLKIRQDWLEKVDSAAHDLDLLRPVSEADLVAAPSLTNEFAIRASDIDWNMHVNNVCYLEWALEAVPASFRLQNKIAELDISFLQEVRYGDSVIAECFAPQQSHEPYLYRILAKSSGKVLALLRILWEPKVTSGS